MRTLLLFLGVIFQCQAVLFDLDGVLVDSTQAVARVWGKWAQQHGLDPEKVIEHAHGRRSIETLQLVAPQLNASQENLHVEKMEIEDTEGVVAIEGSVELLKQLPQERYAVVTSATRALAEARMQHAGLRLPSHMVTANDVVRGKPDPEPYIKGAQMLGFAPDECLAFEDTPAGIWAARKAGTRVIGLTTTCSKSELAEADAVLPSLSRIRVRTNAKGLMLGFE